MTPLLPATICGVLLATLATQGQFVGQKTYCNPIDINYQYNFEQQERGISFRSGADPVIVCHQGEYFLFSTISGGYWHSKDLLNWRYLKPDVTPHAWPKEDMCAPAAISVGNRLYLFQSTFDRRPIWVSTNPASGRFEQHHPLLPQVPGAAGPWDPALFHDPDTGRWFMYFGSSNVYPLYGIELDPERNLEYVGTARDVVWLNPRLHGWERFGPNHTSPIKPFMEGAWMTKFQGRYYLQYGAPGTEYNVYANGTYIGDGPLGPFTYAPNNPIAYKPGGFLTGAGHGNTFQDTHGNWWNTGTPWWAVNFDFERRISLFPAAFDSDGLLYASTRFGDFPHYMPTNSLKSPKELFTGWMLLSYRTPVSASSHRDLFNPAKVTDEDPRSFWVAAQDDPQPWLLIDLGSPCNLRAVQVNFSDYQSGIFASGPEVYTQFRLHASLDATHWTTIADLTAERRDRPNAYLELPGPVKARYLKYEHVHIASPQVAISEIRAFGHATGEPPATPDGLQVRRDGDDSRNAFLSWRPVPDAVGYNILWGISDDKLYQTYQVFADQRPTLELRALTVDQSYSFSIEAFNRSGVSAPAGTVRID